VKAVGSPAISSSSCFEREIPELKASKKITDLMKAAAKGDANLLLKLLETETDINAQDVFGNTALYYSATSNSVEAVLALLSRGASVKTKNQAGFHALKVAARERKTNIIRLLANAGLLQSARDGDAGFVKECIEQSADVNVKTSDGWTPLMIATVKGHPSILQILLNARAEVNSKNGSGQTALWLATSMNVADEMRLLIEGGADVNAQNQDGWTVLMQAASENNSQSLKLLINSGADLNLKNWDGETALAIAEKRGFAEIVSLLTQAGAGNSQDQKQSDGTGTETEAERASADSQDVIELFSVPNFLS